MLKVPWTKICNENMRVEVSRRSSPSKPSERDFDRLADDLNELFEIHREWEDTHAEVQYEEIVRCIFCGDIYSPEMDEKGEEHCSLCGKGKLEYSIKIMAESEKRGER